jgi:NAD-dependent SIR2 family protein deacetylase
MGKGDPKGQLKLLHGNLFDLRCAGGCGYVESDNFTDPLCPALSEERVKDRQNVLGSRADESKKPSKLSALLFEGIAAKNKKILGDKYEDKMPTASDAAPLKGLGENMPNIPDLAPVLKSGIETSELPQCPGCKSNILRPAVVWFGEGLPQDVVDEVDKMFENDHIDLCLVIGTSSVVWPAAGYAEQARKRGARIAVVNMNPKDAKNLRDEDWLFVGDAAVVLPQILGETTV